MSMKDSPRLSDYKERKELENKVAFLLHSRFCEGVSNRPWTRRDEVKADVEALIAKYWPEYRRTPEEQKEYERAINSW